MIEMNQIVAASELFQGIVFGIAAFVMFRRQRLGKAVVFGLVSLAGFICTPVMYVLLKR